MRRTYSTNTWLNIGSGEVEGEINVFFDYRYYAGRPAHYGSPTYPGHPAEPAEVDILHVFLLNDVDDKPPVRGDRITPIPLTALPECVRDLLAEAALNDTQRELEHLP